MVTSAAVIDNERDKLEKRNRQLPAKWSERLEGEINKRRGVEAARCR